MQKCHRVWRIPKNCDLPVCLCLLFSIWAQDFLSILTITSCFLLHDLNCKQQNLKTRAADPATEKKLGYNVRDPKIDEKQTHIKTSTQTCKTETKPRKGLSETFTKATAYH